MNVYHKTDETIQILRQGGYRGDIVLRIWYLILIKGQTASKQFASETHFDSPHLPL